MKCSSTSTAPYNPLTCGYNCKKIPNVLWGYITTGKTDEIEKQGRTHYLHSFKSFSTKSNSKAAPEKSLKMLAPMQVTTS